MKNKSYRNALGQSVTTPLRGTLS